MNAVAAASSRAFGAAGPLAATGPGTSAAGAGDEHPAPAQARTTANGAQITDHPFTFMQLSLQD